MNLTDDLAAILTAIRERAPLIHNVTNYVGMDLTANALLALGASPVMAHASEEVAEMAGIANAVVINIGTLSGPWVQSMRKATAAACERTIPVIFDPVGVGATKYRTSTARMLLEEGGISVVRGNASEILALAIDGHVTKGVDSTSDSTVALDAAVGISENYSVVTIVSGETDFIASTEGVASVHNGSQLLTKVTATGCTVSAIVGACCAVHSSPWRAATVGMIIMGVCGELAEERLNRLPAPERGPGTFRNYLLDALFTLTPEVLKTRAMTNATTREALADANDYFDRRDLSGLSAVSLGPE